MAGFDLGSLLGGLVPSVGNGLKRGLQLFADVAKMLVFAVGHDKPDEVATMKAIAVQWLKEATDEAGNIRVDIIHALETGGDPFRGSRQMVEDAKAKYGVPK